MDIGHHPLEDVAYLVYTSGTPAAQGRRLLHRGSASIRSLSTWFTWTWDTIWGLPRPSRTGLIAQIGTAVGPAFRCSLPSFRSRRDVPPRPQMERNSGCTAITAYIALLNYARQNDIGPDPPFLEKCYSGGAPVAPGIVDQFEQQLGTYIHKHLRTN